MTSIVTSFTPIPERSDATPGLFNSRFQTLQDNQSAAVADLLGWNKGSVSTHVVSTNSFVVPSIDSGGAVYHVQAYGCAVDGITDDLSRFSALLSMLSNGVGGIVQLPPGRMKLSAWPNTPKYLTIQGAGMQSSVIDCSHTSDGIRSTWPTNGSTGAYLILRDLAIVSSATTNGGSGIKEHGGSYVQMERVYVGGFRHQVSLDQTEIFKAEGCYLDSSTGSHCLSGLWLVNGADLVAGTNAGFTNNVSVRDTQFNALPTVGMNVRNDGGVTHHFETCNFNGGATAMEAAGVKSLTLLNCASESHTVRGLSFVSQLGFSGRVVDPCQSITVLGGAYNDATQYAITVEAGVAGSIKGIWASLCSSGVVGFPGAADNIAGWEIGGNHKMMVGTASRVTGPFLMSTLSQAQAQQYRQLPQSYSTTQIASGTRTVAPASMGLLGTTESFTSGQYVYAANDDATSGEVVRITASTSTNFTATYVSSKLTNFTIQGLTPGGFVFAAVDAGTVASSGGTFNLATGGTRLSMRTLAASSVTVSAANTNVAVNEVVFTVGGASGASLCVHSGGTVYVFNSALSAKAT